MFIIKIKVKGYLENLTENTKEIIDTKAIKNSNIISYIKDDVKHKIIIDQTKITILRENNEFAHRMILEKNKPTKSEYYLKEANYEIEFNVLTKNIIVSKNKINITYIITESNTVYNYVLESSDNL